MKQRISLWAMVGILLLALALRTVRLGAQSLWYDETVSVYLAGQSTPDLIAHTAGDIHPPGYYLLLHAWTRLAGRSEFSAAFLSLWFGVLLVGLAGRLGTRLFGRSAGLCAAFLVAVSPFNLWYSQEVRMYTLGAALGMGVLWCLVELTSGTGRDAYTWRALTGYAVLAAMGLWVLYYFAFLLVALNLLACAWWLAARRRRRAGPGWAARWLAAQGLALLLFAPWIPIAWRQATSPPVPPWRGQVSLGRVLVESGSALALGQSADPGKFWPALVLVALLVGLGLASGWRGLRRNRRAPASTLVPRRAGQPAGAAGPWLLAGHVALPLLLIWLASYLSPLYHVRYVFTYSTPFYVLVAAGVAWLSKRSRPAAWIGLAVLAGCSAASAWTYHTDPAFAADDHRAATRFLQEQWRPGDAILVDAGYVYTALLTYWEGAPAPLRGRLVGSAGPGMGDLAQSRPVLLLAGTVGGSAQLGWGEPGSDFYAMGLDDAEVALDRVFAGFSRVWLYRCYDTVTDPYGDLRRWLDEHGIRFEDQAFTGESQLRVQGYLTGRDPLAGTAMVGETLADGSLELLAWSLPASPVAVGGWADLALVWRVGQVPDDGRILFAGLFDESGQRWAQTDVRSAGSLFPVSRWTEGTVVRTPLRVPLAPGTPPGRYRLEVGWYRFVDAQPVWIPWGTGNLLGAGQVEVIAPHDWGALPLPPVRQRIDVRVGQGLRLVGLHSVPQQAVPGDTVRVEIVWQSAGGAAEPGGAVLLLTDDAGHALAEAQVDLDPGTLDAGQVVIAAARLTVPPLKAGVYGLAVGRRAVDGSWLEVRRGVFSLGATVPLATIRVVPSTGKVSP